MTSNANTIDMSGIIIVNQKYRASGAISSAKRTGKRKHRAKHLALLLLLLAMLLPCVLFSHGNAFIGRMALNNAAPSSITAFVEDHPEASSFASNWQEYHDKTGNIKLSHIKKGSYPLFIQWDKKWGYRSYGNGQYLGITGCGPTCLSMVYCGLTGKKDMNPYKMAVFSEEHGYYVKGTGTSWSLMTDGAWELGLYSEQIMSENGLIRSLEAGHPVIASVGAGDFTKTGHFILFTGINDDGTLRINDPSSPSNSKKHWDIDRVYPQIKSMWSFEADDLV